MKCETGQDKRETIRTKRSRKETRQLIIIYNFHEVISSSYKFS